MATIKDVARLANVSIATVSNVLNHTRPVSEPLKKQVLQAVEKLNYNTNPHARGLRSTHSRTIGVIITRMDNVFFPQVLQGIESALKEIDYTYILYNTNYDYAMERKYIKFMLSNNVDGIILGSVAPEDDTAYLQALGRLHSGKKRIPVLSIERDFSAFGIDSVCMENVKGAFIATRHLIEQGCRNIVHISGPQDFPVSKERMDGYTQAMCKAGLQPRIVHGDFLPNSGYSCLKLLLANSTSFDGVFCGNDMMAIGALKAMKDVGIHCPEEVRLIGYDNSFVSSLIQPSLSSILVPQQGLGRKATLLLHKRINGTLDSAAVTVQLPIRLVVRRSSDPNKFDDWSLSIL